MCIVRFSGYSVHNRSAHVLYPDGRSLPHKFPSTAHRLSNGTVLCSRKELTAVVSSSTSGRYPSGCSPECEIPGRCLSLGCPHGNPTLHPARFSRSAPTEPATTFSPPGFLLPSGLFPVRKILKYVIEMAVSGAGENDSVRHGRFAVGAIPANLLFQFLLYGFVVRRKILLKVDIDDDVMEPPQIFLPPSAMALPGLKNVEKDVSRSRILDPAKRLFLQCINRCIQPLFFKTSTA